eukprot:351226-Chlamydomonas_euryale.AAC.1
MVWCESTLHWLGVNQACEGLVWIDLLALRVEQPSEGLLWDQPCKACYGISPKRRATGLAIRGITSLALRDEAHQLEVVVVGHRTQHFVPRVLNEPVQPIHRPVTAAGMEQWAHER